MKAVRFHAHGGLDVLRFEDAPDPQPAPGEVLVRVRACALNHLDLWQRRGMERVRIALPHVPGSDIAGEIVSSGAADLPPGTRVMLQPGVSCGRCEACLAGADNACPHYDVIGYRTDGGYAELVTAPVQNVVPIPAHVSFIDAAAFPLTFVTAWHMLLTCARLQQGETVLVLAAGSGVGQAAVQVARIHGARVIATAGSDAKLARARSLGADAVVNHSTADLAAEVRRLTDRRGVDVVIEHIGQATWEHSVRSLARGGRLVTCGATTGPVVAVDLRFLFGRQLSLVGSYMGTKSELLSAARLFFAGRVAPVIDAVLPLAEAAEAQRRLEQREQFGKIVLEP